MDKFLILLFVVAKVSSASAQCIEPQNASEIFTVDYEGLNFTIAFTVPDQCPSLLLIMANVQQGKQSKEYCHFKNDSQGRQCMAPSRTECVCDPRQARYVINASLNEDDDEGQEWIILGTDKEGLPVFNARVNVALPRVTVTSASVPLHTQTSQFTTEDTFSSQNPVSVHVVTEESAKSVSTLDPNIMMYIVMGGILLLVLVVIVAFGIILYRKVLSAIRKPAESKPASLHEEPVEQQAVIELQQEVIELQQWPMGNQDGAGIRVSALSNASDAYQTIDDSSSSVDSSLGGWPESEFDMDPDSNTLDTAAATGGAPPNHDYENEQTEPARGNGDTVVYENDCIAHAYQNESEFGFDRGRGGVVFANELSKTSLGFSGKRSVAVRVVHHCTPPSDPPVDSPIPESHYTELESDYLNPVASNQETQASVAQQSDRETTQEHQQITDFTLQAEREASPQGAVGGGWTSSGTHSQHIPVPADPTFVAHHKKAPVKFKPCPRKIPRVDGSSFPQHPSQTRVLPSRSQSSGNLLSAQGGSSAAAAREDFNTCPRVPGVHTTPKMGRFDREAMSSSVPEFATDSEGYLEPRQCMGRFDREAMPSSVPEFATDSGGYLQPRQCMATPPRKARAVAGLTQRTALQDGDGAGLQGQGAARQTEGGHKRRDKKRDDASDEEETPDGYMRMKRRQVSVGEHAPFQSVPVGLHAPFQSVPVGLHAPFQSVPVGIHAPFQSVPVGIHAPFQSVPVGIHAPFQSVPVGIHAPFQSVPISVTEPEQEARVLSLQTDHDTVHDDDAGLDHEVEGMPVETVTQSIAASKPIDGNSPYKNMGDF